MTESFFMSSAVARPPRRHVKASDSASPLSFWHLLKADGVKVKSYLPPQVPLSVAATSYQPHRANSQVAVPEVMKAFPGSVTLLVQWDAVEGVLILALTVEGGQLLIHERRQLHGGPQQ